MAMPTQAITLPAFCGPTRPTPQLNAPVMTRLSAQPSSTRPASSTPTDTAGSAAKASDTRKARPEKVETTKPVTTARLAPRVSASVPAQARESKAAANWLPTTRPTTSALMPSVSCTCSGRTGKGRPMVRKPTNTASVIGSSFRKTLGGACEAPARKDDGFM
jgi:hypothetical protein